MPESQIATGRNRETTPLRLTLLTEALGHLAVFEILLRALLERGHHVTLVTGRRADGAETLLDDLSSGHQNFAHRPLPARRSLWRVPAAAVRRRLDLLGYLEPDDANPEAFLERAPLGLRLLVAMPPFRWRSGRVALVWALTRLEAAMPIPRPAKALFAEQPADAVLISPLIEFGSAQVDCTRAATASGVPTVLLLPSGADLDEHGAVRDQPALTVELPSSAEGASDALAEIERAPALTPAPRREGRLLRPVLWLLTPLLLVLLPLARPIATGRALARAVRKGWRRAGKRVRTMRRNRSKSGAAKKAARVARKREAEATAARQAKLDAHAAKQAAKAEAHRAKEAERAAALAAKREARAAQSTNGAGAAATSTASPGSEGPAAAGAEKPKAKAKRAARAERTAKQAGKAKSPFARRARRVRTRVKKGARGRAKRLRRRWKLTRRATRRVYNRRYRLSYRSTIHRVPARDELPALLNARGLTGRGVEIGVKTGLYSNELLTNWRGQELISIDPWLSADPDEYVDRSNVSQDEFERYYQETCERLGRHGSRSTIWRMTSVEAAPGVPDHSLDFVYIDARHDYDSVLEDLAAWVVKVKPGGILAGHDYVDGDLPQGEFYVKSAVDQYFGARQIPVHGTEGPSAVEMFPTWIVEVPESGIPDPRGGVVPNADAQAKGPAPEQSTV